MMTKRRHRRREKILNMIKQLPETWTPFSAIAQMLGLDQYRATSFLKIAKREGLVEHRYGSWSHKTYSRINYWRRIR